MSDLTTPEALAALRNLATAAVSNAIELSAVRLRNEGYIDGTVTLRTSAPTRMVGYALTLQMRTDAPPVTGLSYLDRNDWWDAFATPPLPKVIVIEDTGARVGAGSVAGETHLQIFKALGAVGLVTNGAVRDLRALRDAGLPVYSGSIVASHAYAHIVACNVPVSVGGLTIEPGDLLHGDEDGIVKIPAELAAALPAAAARLAADERKVASICRNEQFSPSRLRAALREIIGRGRQ